MGRWGRQSLLRSWFLSGNRFSRRMIGSLRNGRRLIWRSSSCRRCRSSRHSGVLYSRYIRYRPGHSRMRRHSVIHRRKVRTVLAGYLLML